MYAQNYFPMSIFFIMHTMYVCIFFFMCATCTVCKYTQYCLRNSTETNVLFSTVPRGEGLGGGGETWVKDPQVTHILEDTCVGVQLSGGVS